MQMFQVGTSEIMPSYHFEQRWLGVALYTGVLEYRFALLKRTNLSAKLQRIKLYSRNVGILANLKGEDMGVCKAVKQPGDVYASNKGVHLGDDVMLSFYPSFYTKEFGLVLEASR